MESSPTAAEGHTPSKIPKPNETPVVRMYPLPHVNKAFDAYTFNPTIHIYACHALSGGRIASRGESGPTKPS